MYSWAIVGDCRDVAVYYCCVVDLYWFSCIEYLGTWVDSGAVSCQLRPSHAQLRFNPAASRFILHQSRPLHYTPRCTCPLLLLLPLSSLQLFVSFQLTGREESRTRNQGYSQSYFPCPFPVLTLILTRRRIHCLSTWESSLLLRTRVVVSASREQFFLDILPEAGKKRTFFLTGLTQILPSPHHFAAAQIGSHLRHCAYYLRGALQRRSS